MSEIRKLSVGGESPFDEICMHYQVGSFISKRNDKHVIHRIRKDGKLFHEYGKSEYDIFVENIETKEIFEWKRVGIGSSKNYWEEKQLDFE